jgi:enoyl-CoA hydratase / 3-hydroxyacyl-CoA dehydrogenase
MQIKKAAVIGGGAMGGSIAHLLTSVGIECFVKDIDQKFVDKAVSISKGVYDKLVAKGKLAVEKAESRQALLKGGIEYDIEYMKDVDLIIEAVPEILKLKKQIFAELDKICPEKTILASNTSSLSLSDIAEEIQRKDRFIGLHFFNPAHVMKLVEVIYDQNTSSETLEEMMKFTTIIDKVAIKCKNAPGFVVNRILIPYMNEALLALMDGSGTMEEIDEAMVKFGMPMGPFTLWDLVGLDVAMHASVSLEEAFGKRTPVPDILKIMVEKKMFGQKTGKGFYDYSDKSNKTVNIEVEKYLKNLWKENPPADLDFEPERLLAVQAREALMIAAENVAGAHDIDTGMVYGTNFPTKVAYGPLHWAEEVMGWSNVADIAHMYTIEVGPERFTLPSSIESLANGGSIFNNCTYEVDSNGVALATVENPPMNVLSVKTVNDISNCMLKAIADPSVRVIILTGKGRAFVAGADINEFQQIMTLGGAKEYSERGQLMTNIIEGSDKPVICAINGFALGGGLELAMPCHIRIAADSAKLGLPEINLGIIPGFAGTQRLPRIVGKAKGIEMILTGIPINAQEALAVGLVNKVVPLALLIEEAKGLARIIAKKGRISVSSAMASVMDGHDESFEDGCTIESENFARVKVSADGVEGVDAFLTKRTAKFRDM